MMLLMYAYLNLQYLQIGNSIQFFFLYLQCIYMDGWYGTFARCFRYAATCMQHEEMLRVGQCCCFALLYALQ